MVLIMVPKKIAGKKSPQVVFGLAVGMVSVVCIPHVWEKSAEVKQLKCG